MPEKREDEREPAAEGPAEAAREAKDVTERTSEKQAKASEAPPAPDPRLAALEAREKELVERLARLQADFENYRRRTRDDIARSRADGKLDLIKTMIPVLDNLDRALAHAEDEGLQLLARQLRTTLADAGLVVLDPQGEAFDAKLHEALATETREGVKAGTILTVVEKGYLYDERLLRAARVVVAG